MVTITIDARTIRVFLVLFFAIFIGSIIMIEIAAHVPRYFVTAKGVRIALRTAPPVYDWSALFIRTLIMSCIFTAINSHNHNKKEARQSFEDEFGSESKDESPIDESEKEWW